MEKTGNNLSIMNSSFNNIIKGTPVNQNQQDFVIAKFTISQILSFTKYTKRLIVNYDDENKPIYNKQIQRFVEKSRVEKIADFLINDREATFPTNIVLSVPNQAIKGIRKTETSVEIILEEKVAEEIKKDAEHADVYITIIDGQHRIRGIEVAIDRLNEEIDSLQKVIRTSINPKEEIKNQLKYYIQRLNDLYNIELVVSFFIDKSLEYQAMIFSTINRTQKRVSPSLVYSLFGLSEKPSPQKTALHIVFALNSNENSPLYKRIKLYGGDYEKGQSPQISQASMVKSIVELICENWREAENDRFRKRKELLRRTESSDKYLPFRKYYALDDDTKISDILYFYFKSVHDRFKDGETYLWDVSPESNKPTNIIQTTVGFQALLMILVDILNELDSEKSNKEIEGMKFQESTYTDYLKRIKKTNLHDTQRYPFTSISKSILYLDLNLEIWPALNEMDKRKIRLRELLEKIY